MWLQALADGVPEKSFFVNLYPDADDGYFYYEDLLEWREFNIEISKYTVITVILYLCMVFGGPKIIKACGVAPWRPIPLIAAWNLFLALFSIFGAYRVMLPVINVLWQHGFHTMTCVDKSAWLGYSGYWGFLFGFSKYVELIDTFWLVVGQRKIMFLHWYHHTTVLLFCWHGMIAIPSTACWYSPMNYIVHSVMYTYYFFTQIKKYVPTFYGFIRKYRSLITILQIAQMILGAGVTFYAAYQINIDNCPSVPAENAFYGVIIYVSYLVLFVQFFIESFCLKREPKKTKKIA